MLASVYSHSSGCLLGEVEHDRRLGEDHDAAAVEAVEDALGNEETLDGGANIGKGNVVSYFSRVARGALFAVVRVAEDTSDDEGSEVSALSAAEEAGTADSERSEDCGADEAEGDDGQGEVDTSVHAEDERPGGIDGAERGHVVKGAASRVSWGGLAELRQQVAHGSINGVSRNRIAAQVEAARVASADHIVVVGKLLSKGSKAEVNTSESAGNDERSQTAHEEREKDHPLALHHHLGGLLSRLFFHSHPAFFGFKINYNAAYLRAFYTLIGALILFLISNLDEAPYSQQFIFN